MTTFASISEKRPIFVFFFGPKWKSFPNALAECKDNFPEYLQRLVDVRQAHLFDDIFRLQNFLLSDIKKDSHVIFHTPLLSSGEVFATIPLLKLEGRRMFGIIIDSESFNFKGLEERFRCHIVALKEEDLKCNSFRALVSGMFKLKPLD